MESRAGLLLQLAGQGGSELWAQGLADGHREDETTADDGTSAEEATSSASNSGEGAQAEELPSDNIGSNTENEDSDDEEG